MPSHTEYAAALHAAINAIPEDARAFVVNFVAKNAHRPAGEMLARMERTLKDRAEAEAVERHRQEKVLHDYAEMTGQSVGVLLEGQGLASGQGETSKKKGK